MSQDAVVRPWRAGAEPLQSGGPTLLHLAAGLGYSRLACALLHWRAENPSSVLDAEVDALRQDSAGLTPLAWACAAGHADTARILYRFVRRFLEIFCAFHDIPCTRTPFCLGTCCECLSVCTDGTQWRFA